MCHAHYLRTLRVGDTKPDQPIVKRGPGRDQGPPGRRRPSRAMPAADITPERKLCTVEGCDRPARGRGWCVPHYKRWKKHGDVRAAVPLRGAPGTGYVHWTGYVVVAVPAADRWLVGGSASAAEHRLAMALHLGRPLSADESVHHRNGNRRDNRIENLELWSRWQPSGQRVTDKLRWAVEILGRYAPHRLAEPEPDASARLAARGRTKDDALSPCPETRGEGSSPNEI